MKPKEAVAFTPKRDNGAWALSDGFADKRASAVCHYTLWKWINGRSWRSPSSRWKGSPSRGWHDSGLVGLSTHWPLESLAIFRVVVRLVWSRDGTTRTRYIESHLTTPDAPISRMTTKKEQQPRDCSGSLCSLLLCSRHILRSLSRRSGCKSGFQSRRSCYHRTFTTSTN